MHAPLEHALFIYSKRPGAQTPLGYHHDLRSKPPVSPPRKPVGGLFRPPQVPQYLAGLLQIRRQAPEDFAPAELRDRLDVLAADALTARAASLLSRTLCTCTVGQRSRAPVVTASVHLGAERSSRSTPPRRST